MSISRQNLTVIIVTFKSDMVIQNCINSINNDIKILIIDNSNNQNFKNKIEKEYKNVSCILSEKNIGMGSANNLGIKNIKTDYALILNPDVTLEPDAINEIIEASKKIDSFCIIAPLEKNKDYPNYKLDKKINIKSDQEKPFRVKSVDGYAMLLNLKRINLLNDFQYFDENFFMYLENDDLCKRLVENSEKIYVVPKSKINHLGGKAVDQTFEYEIELSRNWHWIWSKFYFNKKHFGFFWALLNSLPSFFSSILKLFFYFIVFNKRKKNIYLKRIQGFWNALLGKPSSYRPNVF